MPDVSRRLMFIPIDIPSKYFPLVLYAFFCLFGGPSAKLAVALCVGYLYSKGHMDSFKPSVSYTERCESTGFLAYFNTGAGWIRTSAAVSNGAWSQQQQAGEASRDRQPGQAGGSAYAPTGQQQQGKQEPRDQVRQSVEISYKINYAFCKTFVINLE